MKLLINGCAIGVLLCCALCQDAREIDLTDSESIISWSPTSSETIKIYADEGYQIQVDVTQFDVDGENDNYMSIKSIEGDEEDEDNELMLTYVVSGKPSYLYNSNKIQAEYVGNDTSDNVVVQFTRVGEALTTVTTVSTTTLEPMPTPAVEEKATISVYLYGLAASSFDESEVKVLRQAIAKMGQEYCEVQNCPLNSSITWNNAQIDTLQQCSVMWVNYDECINLIFALPIVKADDQENPLWDGYQLSESHLKILWETYGSKYMGQIGLSLYPVPNINKIYKYRIIIACLVIVTVVVLVLLARYISGKLHKKRRKLSDTISIMDRSSNRVSQLSLTPHYLQELPPYFTSDFPLYPEQRNIASNYSDYNKAYVEDDNESITQSTGNQLNISSNSNNVEDAEA